MKVYNEFFSPKRWDKLVLTILSAGFILRLIEFFRLSIIQRDSPIYLYQAMVLAKGSLELLDLCGLSSKIEKVNLFSVAIVPFYYLFKDWEIAGKMVSLISSSLSLVLLYLILRKLLEKPLLYLVLLLYSFNPTLIKESAEVMRESFFTLLVLLGVWFFIKGFQTETKRRIFFFVLANLFWTLSSWVRVEGIFLIVLTFIYLLVLLLSSQDKKSSIATIFTFSFIPFIILLISILYISFYKWFLLIELKGKIALLNPFEHPFAKQLKDFKYFDIPMPSPYFWDLLKQNLWLVAFGTTFFYKFIPALHFSNFLLFLFGFKNLKSYIKEKPLVLYFLILSLGYFGGLWYFTFTKWYMEKRYMLPLLYFLSPILALGIDNVKNFFQQRFNFSTKRVLLFLIVYILFFSSLKVFQSERVDKLWIKTIALDIAKFITDEELKGCSEKACKNLVFTREGRVLFYLANYKGVVLCPAIEDRRFYVKLGEKSSDEVANYIKSKGYRVALLEKEVFKEKCLILKELLESLGIKAYLI